MSGLRFLVRDVSTALLVFGWVGVEPRIGSGGGWVLAHCWALRNHIPCGLLDACLARVGRVGVLVGLVVDSWIVDASICITLARRLAFRALGVWGGGWLAWCESL